MWFVQALTGGTAALGHIGVQTGPTQLLQQQCTDEHQHYGCWAKSIKSTWSLLTCSLVTPSKSMFPKLQSLCFAWGWEALYNWPRPISPALLKQTSKKQSQAHFSPPVFRLLPPNHLKPKKHTHLAWELVTHLVLQIHGALPHAGDLRRDLQVSAVVRAAVVAPRLVEEEEVGADPRVT